MGHNLLALRANLHWAPSEKYQGTVPPQPSNQKPPMRMWCGVPGIRSSWSSSPVLQVRGRYLQDSTVLQYCQEWGSRRHVKHICASWETSRERHSCPLFVFLEIKAYELRQHVDVKVHSVSMAFGRHVNHSALTSLLSLVSCWHLIWLRKQHLPCPQPPTYKLIISTEIKTSPHRPADHLLFAADAYPVYIPEASIFSSHNCHKISIRKSHRHHLLLR